MLLDLLRTVGSRVLSAFPLLLALPAFGAPRPEWIWHNNRGAPPAENEVRYFRTTFVLDAKPASARLQVACDNAADAFLNGQPVLKNENWQEPTEANVTASLQPGTNILAVHARNQGGPAAVLVRLEFTPEGGRSRTIVSDTNWTSSATPSADWKVRPFSLPDWPAAVSLGTHGIAPWGDVLAGAHTAAARAATPVTALKALDGFKVELLRSAASGEGSWVALAVDPKGRLIVSPERKEPMLRITLDAQGQIAKVENIDLPVTGAMGLLYAFGGLYVNGAGPQGYHLYKLTDTDGDDQFDQVDLLRRWKGGPGEHGAHGIVQGPDDHLYIVCGNFVGVPGDLAATSPHRNYRDDVVLPRLEDGNGFGANLKPPGGYVLRCDPQGGNAELFAAGQRNTYDIAFNTDGELFGFDSDMEWDWGSPWYRPVRVFHIVSGGDQGFREGSAKWPEYYQDSLPATVNIGIGSPTGVRFGTGARFPGKYQNALYIMDWTYGRILAVHLTPAGATYAGAFEEFVVPAGIRGGVRKQPLNVTDLEIGPDGAMYFTIGGRGTQAGLYRVSYTGSESTERVVPVSFQRNLSPDKTARAARRALEKLHGQQDPAALDTAWDQIDHRDRFIRYAARVALETVPPDAWRDRAVAETRPFGGLTALLALARVGTSADQPALLKALARWPLDSLDEELKLLKLRVIAVSFSRHGLPAPELRQLALDKLSRQYPAATWPLNRELSQLLIALGAPDAVAKTLALRDSAVTQEEQLHYQVALRRAEAGWSLEDRRRYFTWFQRRPAGGEAPANSVKSIGYTVTPSAKHSPEFDQWFADAGLKPVNGASYANFLKNLRKAAGATLNESERTELASLLSDASAGPTGTPKKERKFVREWKMADVLPDLELVARGRNFARGREAYAAAQCAACHRLGEEGGAVGSDLTAVASRFTRRDILESILAPSKVVSEQYQNTTITLKDGDDVTGRILEENDVRIVLVPNQLTGEKVEVKKGNVQARVPAKVSPMPANLADILTRDELLDLLAYIESGGRKEHAAFR